MLWLAFVLSAGLSGCSTTHSHLSGLPVRYHNARYDFTFYLAQDWKGFSAVMDDWEGITYVPEKDKDVVLARGPIITLRNPRWKTNNLYQDIPIYIFTCRQWEDIHAGKYGAEGAGGIISELWHNEKYVFAIHSRYNAADSVDSWQEAQDMVNQNYAAHPEPHLRDE